MDSIHEYEMHTSTLISLIEEAGEEYLITADNMKIPKIGLLGKILSLTFKLDLLRYRLQEFKEGDFHYPAFLASKYDNPKGFIALAAFDSLVIELFSTLDHFKRLSGYLADCDWFSDAFSKEYRKLAPLRKLRNKLVHQEVPLLQQKQKEELEKDVEAGVNGLCNLAAMVFSRMVESFFSRM